MNQALAPAPVGSVDSPCPTDEVVPKSVRTRLIAHSSCFTHVVSKSYFSIPLGCALPDAFPNDTRPYSDEPLFSILPEQPKASRDHSFRGSYDFRFFSLYVTTSRLVKDELV